MGKKTFFQKNESNVFQIGQLEAFRIGLVYLERKGIGRNLKTEKAVGF